MTLILTPSLPLTIRISSNGSLIIFLSNSIKLILTIKSGTLVAALSTKSLNKSLIITALSHWFYCKCFANTQHTRSTVFRVVYRVYIHIGCGVWWHASYLINYRCSSLVWYPPNNCCDALKNKSSVWLKFNITTVNITTVTKTRELIILHDLNYRI